MDVSLTDKQQLPIGVFDSGMGGLTVLSALQKNLPNESYIYLGDTARLPYGTKSATTVERYAQQATAQLVALGVKAVVVACNTASAIGLPSLKEKYPDLPIFGVVEPGAEAALRVANDTGILVLATQSTIVGGAYQKALLGGKLKGDFGKKHAPNLPRQHLSMPIFGRSCPLWVTLAELGPQPQELIDTILLNDLRGFIDGGPNTVLLGCTHFPAFQDHIQRIVGPTVAVVDSASTTAKAVAAKLAQDNLQNPIPTTNIRYLVTDGIARFRQVGAYFLATTIEDVELVDL